MIVVDASAALEVLLNTRTAQRVAARLFERDRTLHAPHLIDVEVAQVLRRLLRRGEIGATRATQALDDLSELPLTRYPHLVLLPRIWSLRENATAYDASYLALAEALDAVLVTCDAALASVPGCSAKIEVIEG